MTFAPEPPYRHGSAPRTAVLLVNLGTPDAPTPAALRRYLAEFLWDPRVVEIPRPLWWLILNGVILRTRPAKSAAKYASIWTEQGSPLLHWSARQAELLQAELAQRGHAVLVRHAMRYGAPSLGSVLVKSPIMHTSCAHPWLPPVASATTGPANEPARPSHTSPSRPTKN